MATLHHSAPVAGTPAPSQPQDGQLLSESEVLRRLNLPRSRTEWLRAELVSRETAGVRLYRECDVAALANVIAGKRGHTPPNFYVR